MWGGVESTVVSARYDRGGRLSVRFVHGSAASRLRHRGTLSRENAWCCIPSRGGHARTEGLGQQRRRSAGRVGPNSRSVCCRRLPPMPEWPEPLTPPPKTTPPHHVRSAGRVCTPNWRRPRSSPAGDRDVSAVDPAADRAAAMSVSTRSDVRTSVVRRRRHGRRTQTLRTKRTRVHSDPADGNNTCYYYCCVVVGRSNDDNNDIVYYRPRHNNNNNSAIIRKCEFTIIILLPTVLMTSFIRLTFISWCDGFACTVCHYVSITDLESENARCCVPDVSRTV